jgi:FlaA1/EpsC-like NDP-sugar epimerase
MNILDLIGRDRELFEEDMLHYEKELKEIISSSSFLVIGGAGSIGQAVSKEIFRRNPRKLHIVDISENNLVELLRDIRSSSGYISGDFQTFSLDAGSPEYEAFIRADGQYDYVLNLSALKHVRSEKDPYTLMRMIDVNIFNTDKTLGCSILNNSKKYFCVSTDKATNPVNMMGASKRIMEMFLMYRSNEINISTARFANVAFSDGSLLHSFTQRIQKMQPIVAPNDIRRYFITSKEAGELCLMSCIFGGNREIFFPKMAKDLHLASLSDIAIKYLKAIGYEPFICEDEEEARKMAKTLPHKNYWPCLFTIADTTGEKGFEEFYSGREKVELKKFAGIGIINNDLYVDHFKIKTFTEKILQCKKDMDWTRRELIELFTYMIPEFRHKETGKFLDAKM